MVACRATVCLYSRAVGCLGFSDRFEGCADASRFCDLLVILWLGAAGIGSDVYWRRRRDPGNRATAGRRSVCEAVTGLTVLVLGGLV
jgi:hypothetical protein